MSVTMFSVLRFLWMLCLIAICGLFSRWLSKRLGSKSMGLAAFMVLMLAMWCDTFYQQLVLKPKLCASPESGVKVYSTVKLPPEYYRPDGGGTELFSKHFGDGSLEHPPNVMLLDRYFLASNSSDFGTNSFNRYRRAQTGVWDFKERRWMSVATYYHLNNSSWWETPFLKLPDTEWAKSRLSKSAGNACSPTSTQVGLYTALGLR